MSQSCAGAAEKLVFISGPAAHRCGSLPPGRGRGVHSGLHHPSTPPTLLKFKRSEDGEPAQLRRHWRQGFPLV